MPTHVNLAAAMSELERAGLTFGDFLQRHPEAVTVFEGVINGAVLDEYIAARIGYTPTLDEAIALRFDRQRSELLRRLAAGSGAAQ